MNPRKVHSQNGFAHVPALICVIITLILVGIIAFRVIPILTNKAPENKTQSSVAEQKPAILDTPIQIKGDEACKTSTLEALKLLHDRAPEHYATVVKYVGVIECAPQGSGMFAADDPPRQVVGDDTRSRGTVWYASGIAHEAGHSKLYNDYKDAHPETYVPSEVWSGESAERICLDAQYDALSKIGGTPEQLEYIKNVINTKYYEVPYGERWW